MIEFLHIPEPHLSFGSVFDIAHFLIMSDVKSKVERLLIYSKHFVVLHVNSIAHIQNLLIF